MEALVMDKFLLAENPMREDSELWVIHLLEPRAIIRCTEGHVKIDNIYRHYQFRSSDGIIEGWTLSAYHLFTTDFLTEPEEQAGKLLDRAWRWFRSYLEFVDENIDRNEQANDN
jgi:hypothetical protein